MTGPSSEAARVLQMWAVLAQAVAAGWPGPDDAAGHTRYQNENIWFSLTRASKRHRGPLLPKERRDHYVDACRQKPAIMRRIDTAVELRQKKSDRQEQAWLDAARLIHMVVRSEKTATFGTKVPPDHILKKEVSAALLRLIQIRTKETVGAGAARFAQRRYYRTMRENGYSNPTNAGWDKDADILLRVYGEPQFRRRLREYRRMRYKLEEYGWTDADEKLQWRVFFDQMILALESILEYIDRRKKIFLRTHYIAADALHGSSDHGAIRKRYEKKYIPLRNEMIMWAQSADLMVACMFIRPGRGGCIPVFEPQSTEAALFWGYYGVRCEKCKSWRVRHAGGRRVRCDIRGCEFEPGFTVHCTGCWRRYDVKKEKNDGGYSEYRIWYDGREPVEYDGTGRFDCRCGKAVSMSGPTGNCLRTDTKKIAGTGIRFTPEARILPSDVGKSQN